MHLADIIIPTGVARSGMKVADVFEECVAHNVPGLPYCDADGRVIGRVSIRHTLKVTCIPEYMVKGAHMLGDAIDSLMIDVEQIRDILELPVDRFVLQKTVCMSPGSPVVKALSSMEHFNSDYVFLVENGRYLGIVTRMGITRLLLQKRRS